MGQVNHRTPKKKKAKKVMTPGSYKSQEVDKNKRKRKAGAGTPRGRPKQQRKKKGTIRKENYRQGFISTSHYKKLWEQICVHIFPNTIISILICNLNYRNTYTSEDMDEAVRIVLEEDYSIAQASKVINSVKKNPVPRTSLGIDICNQFITCGSGSEESV